MTLSVTRSNLIAFAVRSIQKGDVGKESRDRIEAGIEAGLDLLAQRRRFSFQQDTYDIITVPAWTGGATVGTAAIGIGDDTVTISGADNLPTDIVGQFIELNGERNWHEITIRNGNDTLDIHQPYSRESGQDLSGAPFVILYAHNDLPANFYKERALYDVTLGQEVRIIPYDAGWRSKLERIGSGLPENAMFKAKRHDPNQWQALITPAPSIRKRYTLVYFRFPGWYSTATPATSAWSKRAPAGAAGDNYYVDWPETHMYILEAAVQAMVAREVGRENYRQLLADFEVQAERAANMDVRTGHPVKLGGGYQGHAGLRMDF